MYVLKPWARATFSHACTSALALMYTTPSYCRCLAVF